MIQKVCRVAPSSAANTNRLLKPQTRVSGLRWGIFSSHLQIFWRDVWHVLPASNLATAFQRLEVQTPLLIADCGLQGIHGSLDMELSRAWGRKVGPDLHMSTTMLHCWEVIFLKCSVYFPSALWQSSNGQLWFLESRGCIIAYILYIPWMSCQFIDYLSTYTTSPFT